MRRWYAMLSRFFKSLFCPLIPIIYVSFYWDIICTLLLATVAIALFFIPTDDALMQSDRFGGIYSLLYDEWSRFVFTFYTYIAFVVCSTIFLFISSRSPYKHLTSSPITLVSALTYCILFEYYDWSVFTRYSLFFSKAFLSPSFIHHICTFYMYKAFVVYSTIYLFVLQVIWRGLLSVGSFVGSLEQVQVLPCL